MKEYIKMIVVLSGICAISGLSLSGLKAVTAERIEVQVLNYVQGPALTTAFGEYDNDPIAERQRFDLPDGQGSITVFPARKDGTLVAVAFETFGKGYGGDIGIMVGFSMTENLLTGIGVTTMKETPGLGARIAKHGFTSQFHNHPPDNLALVSQGGDIDAVSGATFSSLGTLEAIGKANAIFTELRDAFATAWQ